MSENNLHATVDDRRFGQAMILYAICILLLLFVGSPLQTVSLKIGLAATLLLLILLPAVLFTLWKKVPVAEGLRLRPVSPAVLLLSLLYGIGGLSIGVAIALGLEKMGVPAMNLGLGAEMNSTGAFLMMLLVGAVLPGICEETLFRGVIQGVLERRGKWLAVIVTAVLFGLFHMDPIRVVAASVLGLLFGWLTIRTGSLIPAMTGHFANNATSFSVSYFLGGFEKAPGWLLPAMAVLFVVAAAAIVAVTKSKQASLTPSPLAAVPAGLSPLVAWGCGIPAVLGVAGVVGVTAIAAQLLDTVVLEDGSQALVFESDSPGYRLDEGLKYAFEQDGEHLVGKAEDIDENEVTLTLDDGTEVVISRDKLGMVVHIF